MGTGKCSSAPTGKGCLESIRGFFFWGSLNSNDDRIQIWFPGSPESDQQKALFEREGFRLISLCGYSVKKVNPVLMVTDLSPHGNQKSARYVGIWQKPVLRSVPYEAHYGVSLSECLEINDRLAARSLQAVGIYACI
jgi:hypothetical protein